jgi:hypothetical protein
VSSFSFIYLVSLARVSPNALVIPKNHLGSIACGYVFTGVTGAVHCLDLAVILLVEDSWEFDI